MGTNIGAVMALLGVILLFGAVLSVGWHRLLLTSVWQENEFIAWGLAVVIAFFAVIMARQVAYLRHKNDRTWWAYFFVLFTLSALGTLNTVFYYGEGRLVLAENLDRAGECLSQLDLEASRALSSPRYDAKKARVEQLMIGLEAEIRNPVNCGQGPVANSIIQRIRAELPQFAPLSNAPGQAAHLCEADQLISAYKNTVARLLRTTPEYTDARIEEKEKFVDKLNKIIKNHRDSLLAAKAQLNAGTFEDAKRVVEQVAGTSTEFKSKNILGGESASIKCGIDLNAVRGLGSPSQIIPLLINRSDRVSTYIYIMAAILADIILIMCFAQILRGSETYNAGNPTPIRGTSAPIYLWSNT